MPADLLVPLADLLAHLTDPAVARGLQQVAVAALLAAAVVGVSRLRALDLEGEFAVALVRGLVQVVAMGSIVGVLLTAPFAWSGVVLVAMVGGATLISRERGEGLPGATRASAFGIALGAGLTIVTMTLAGAIEATVRNLVPVGSMIIANAMQTNSLALDRLREDLRTDRARVEADLALGASPATAVAPLVRTGVRASLIPAVDSLKSLGWVWIPGIMAGMILAGENPVYAALYQFVIMAMIFGAGGLTSMTSSWLVSRYAFTEAEQLRQVRERSG